jgi:hypothetical protein
MMASAAAKTIFLSLFGVSLLGIALNYLIRRLSLAVASRLRPSQGGADTVFAVRVTTSDRSLGFTSSSEMNNSLVWKDCGKREFYDDADPRRIDLLSIHAGIR